jgi:hypothetical protein
VDTQAIKSTGASELCPKGIVEQLLELADKHNCISEIGAATAWRWREGIITRMPRKNTVCKVLKQAFNSEDPEKWFLNTSGELKRYIKNAFPFDRDIVNIKPDDVYEAFYLLSISDGRGVTFDELLFKLAYIKFCKHEDVEPQYFPDFPDEDLLLKINGAWAKKKALKIIEKFGVTVNDLGFYKLPPGYRTLVNDEFNHYTSELIRYRLKAVAGRSHFDMWRHLTCALSDSEMIEIEKKVIKFHKRILEDINEISSRKLRDEKTLKTRFFRMDCASIPNKSGEVIEWLD